MSPDQLTLEARIICARGWDETIPAVGHKYLDGAYDDTPYFIDVLDALKRGYELGKQET